MRILYICRCSRHLFHGFDLFGTLQQLIFMQDETRWIARCMTKSNGSNDEPVECWGTMKEGAFGCIVCIGGQMGVEQAFHGIPIRIFCLELPLRQLGPYAV